MFKNIKTAFENYKINRFTKQWKLYHTHLPELLKRHKELKKYVPKLVELSRLKNRLIYEKNIKGTEEIQFALLMLRRNQDLFEAIIFSLWNNNVHAIFPLMRALVDDLFLLKYVDKHPEYIAEFMDLKKDVDRSKKSSYLRSQSKDILMRKYYDWLSDRTHPNPISLKYHLFKPVSVNGSKSDEIKSAILIAPSCDEFYLQSVEALIRICFEELNIIQKIYLRNTSDLNQERNKAR